MALQPGDRVPFWLKRVEGLDFDPLTDVRDFDDLSLFPNVVDELEIAQAAERIRHSVANARPAGAVDAAAAGYPVLRCQCRLTVAQ
ncbi:hypothetical protein ACIQRW_36050 [Streptomyces sp. NPDC091287]|uniref:hypothetical protein n=1 Tax=Streptomyces sp. NPDC091287 TaxID=3365988 RepID=UPI003830BAA1